ncbi:hypothetical protein [Tenacibaculum sp. 190524A05c]|uniref:hypothetical protein n=1 Tax=Tenacibaculum platacis TaxID=3137852 RepID=UPI0031FAC40E
MVIIDRQNSGQDGVGEWFYDFFELDIYSSQKYIVKTNFNDKRLLILNEVLKILSKSNLFILKSFVINAFDKDEKRHEIKINYDKNTSTELSLESLFYSYLEAYDNLDVFSLKFFFDTNVLLEEEKYKLIQETFIVSLDTMNLSLLTDCDVWLPFDLRGNNQKELAQLNAPRLEKVLRDIENKVGEEIVEGDSKYAHVEKYRVKNILDGFNQPLNVFD